MNIENILESLTSFDSIFVNLLNVSISSCWLVGAVLLFRLIFRKAPRWLIVALWAVVAVRLICPVPIESSFSLIPSAEPLPAEVLHIDPHKGVENTTVEIINNPVYSGYVNTSVPVDVKNFQWDAVLGGLTWLYGVGAMLLYTFLSYLLIYLKVKQSIKHRENIYLCDRINTPFIFGILRPKIYLPSFMNEDNMTYVIAHEKAHIRRRDYLWKPLGFLILTVYWFNPVIWLSYILLCRDIELACDEKVIKEMGSEIKKPYSIALINCSVPKRMITACPVAFGETGVKKRIKAVLSYKKPALWLIIIAVLTSIILAVCFATSPKREKGILTERSYLIQTDEDKEMFRFDEAIEHSEYFTVYKGKKSYFKATPGNGRSTVLNFLKSLSLERLPDMKAEGLTHSGKIEAANAEGNIEVVFCDGFSKMFMHSTEGSTVTESTLYAVDAKKAKAFFNEGEYIKQGNIWECNFTSSAWGYGEIHFFLPPEAHAVSEPTASAGTIIRHKPTDGKRGDLYIWRPEITTDGIFADAIITFEVIALGKKDTYHVKINKVGENDNLSSYFLISAENTVIGSYGTNHEFSLSSAVTLGEENEWYYNPNLSSVGYSRITFSVPTDYIIKSVECTNGTCGLEEKYPREPEGERFAWWSPEHPKDWDIDSYEITVNALKNGEETSFTIKVSDTSVNAEADIMGGKQFRLDFLGCTAKYNGWATYELQENEKSGVTDLDKAISKAILDINAKYKAFGECPAEGHIIFGTEEKKGIVTVYMIEEYMNYGFVDGWFIDQSGHSVPAVMRFEHKNGEYIFLDTEYAEDGANHLKSIKRMFPKIYESRATKLTEKERASLKSQTEAYARAYLDTISRDAPIGTYSDINSVLLTDLGVSVDVSNKLNGLKANYDTGKIGWFEKIENGIRYIYRTSYTQETNRIIYTKENYETKEIVEKIEVDSLSGNVVSAMNSPVYSKYFDAEVIKVNSNKKDVIVKPFGNTEESKIHESIRVHLGTLDEDSIPSLYEGLYIRIFYDGKIKKGESAEIKGASAIYLYADMNYIGSQAPSSESSESTTATKGENIVLENVSSFDAEVIDVSKNGDWLLVKPFEGAAERNSSDKIQVSAMGTDLEGRTDIKKGTKVRIMYDGLIQETYPAQIRGVYSIYLHSELPDSTNKAPTTKAYYITD